MTQKDKFIAEGFNVVDENSSNSKLQTPNLLDFLKENYPQVIRDGEINLTELKTIAGLPIDEKVNGYGLNFIGRNVARAKYDQKTTKELKINSQFSRNFDATQNMVLKGDNLDCLKILKAHYSGQIKCIYIDPPYNTDSDNFVYPDKFDKEEQEVLGLANLSESDMDRLEFSFKTKKSHNGWLSFMYPRLMLARDLLSNDGVIFISIDDNEQANLKLLCDEVFGEENFVANLIWNLGTGTTAGHFTRSHEYILVYSKEKSDLPNFDAIEDENILHGALKKISKANPASTIEFPAGIEFEGKNAEFIDEIGGSEKQIIDGKMVFENGRLKYPVKITAGWGMKNQVLSWLKNQDTYDSKGQKVVRFFFNKQGILWYEKERGRSNPKSVLSDLGSTKTGTSMLTSLLGESYVDFPKSLDLLKFLILLATSKNDFILDFFAGSGTTAHAVMQLNAEDGGNRKFILCQIDEPIREDKPAYKFCIDNGFPPVISSITCERIKRAGDKIRKEIEEENAKVGLFEENKKEIPDTGFKVFDLIDAPKLELENGQIVFQNMDNDPISRIYNMIFQVGIDNPTANLETVLEGCMYRIGNNYYITNAEELNKPENKHFLSDAIKSGKVFIDGWTASINTTLQNYKEDVRVVF